jgi:uncharacterized membrane protein
MYSKAKIAGHPIHPMLVAYPIAGNTGTLVGFILYAVKGDQFWLDFAIAMNYVAVFGAVLAALPGFVDWAVGIPRDSSAKKVGLGHMGLNVASLVLFAVNLGVYGSHWDGPPRSATLGVTLSAIGVGCTVLAGFLGWTLVQNFHVGVTMSPVQETDEPAVQHSSPLRPRHNRTVRRGLS